MKKRFYLIDDKGNKIDDLYNFAENPETKQKLIELLNERKKLGLSNDGETLKESIKLQAEIYEVGLFRKRFRDLFTTILQEIENNSENKNFLLEQKQKAEILIDVSKLELSYRPDNKEIIKNWSFANESMQTVINHIDRFLSRLEFNKSPKILAFNNDIEGSLYSIEIILHDINKLLFDGSTSPQWKQLLKGEILENPIVIKKTIKMDEFKYFIDKLSTEYQILKGRIYTELECNKVFFWNGEILAEKKIRNYHKRKIDGLKSDIDKMLSILN